MLSKIPNSKLLVGVRNRIMVHPLVFRMDVQIHLLSKRLTLPVPKEVKTHA